MNSKIDRVCENSKINLKREQVMRRSILVVLTIFFGLMSFTIGQAGEENGRNAAISSLKSDFPGIRTYFQGSVLTRVFGKRFGSGSSPVSAAEQFRFEYSALFNITPEELKPGSDLVGGLRTLPLMYDRDIGEYKFTLVYYSQFRNEIPVFRADLGLLVRNVPGYPLVMAASALRDLGDFQPPSNVIANVSLAQTAARSFYPELNISSEPRMVIWAGVNDQVVDPSLAMEIIADNGKYATSDYEKWLFVIDAVTGEILYSENLIINVDVTGNVSGMATEGWGADICGDEVLTPLPYARVDIQGGEWAYADENGDFTIPNDGDTEVTVVSDIRGQWFRVYNQSGGNAHLTQLVVPPGPADFIHNEANSSEYNRAEVNGYIQANVVRDFVLTYNPTYPVIYSQEQFPVNVNLNDNCNAYYDYSSINFFTSGGGCPNTAFSTVVHHEYGHHLVAVGGSGQGQYGEGLGDVMGVMISDNPGLAYGFFSNCSQPLRNADNNYQYPCNGEIHDCGQLISGCVWDTRNELLASYPDEYMDILGSLVVNSIPLHRGDLINPEITIDILTLDDDNGDLDDGTPHYDEICAGFGAHNMDCPEIVYIDFAYPDGLPDLIDPDGGTTVNVEVFGVTLEPQSGTGILHYNGGAGWEEADMEETEPNVYIATFPAFECGTEVLYYFSAQTENGDVITDPRDAPTTTFSTLSATSLITVFEDDFETDQGWLVENSPDLTDGPWERAVPITECDRGNPIADFDGSGTCYVTDNSPANACNSDVDGGHTYLISPSFNLTDMGAVVKYALWYTNGYGDDPYNDIFNVHISANDGQSWVLVETIGPVSAAGWMYRSFIVNDYITPTDQVRVRFDASDLNSGSIIEAGIDAFEIVKWECEPTDVTEDVDNPEIPAEFALIGGYPNPFNARVTIQYALPIQSQVTIEIYDLLGRRIETIVNGMKQAGYHQVSWNAENNSTGVYFYRINAGDFTDTKKLVLLK